VFRSRNANSEDFLKMTERDVFLEVTESCVTFIKECCERDEGEAEDIKEGLFELMELILQYGILILDMDDSDTQLCRH